MHLITGYAGQEHITSSDEGTYNIATYGAGQFVLNRGEKFKYTVLSNSAIRISDGEALMQGRYIKINAGAHEDLTIENGSQGMYRNDLIVIRYSKSASDSKESASLVVIKGSETTGTPADPSYTVGTITDGEDLVNDMPLYRVAFNGINITSVTSLFAVKTSMVEYMETYQLMPATSSRLGGIKVGSGLSVTSDGTLSNPYTLPTASASTLGGIKVGDRLSINNGVLSADTQTYNLPTASASTLGGIKVGNGLSINNGVLSGSTPSITWTQETVYAPYGFTVEANSRNGFTFTLENDGDIYIYNPETNKTFAFSEMKVGITSEGRLDKEISIYVYNLASGSAGYSESSFGSVLIGKFQ